MTAFEHAYEGSSFNTISPVNNGGNPSTCHIYDNHNCYGFDRVSRAGKLFPNLQANETIKTAVSFAEGLEILFSSSKTENFKYLLATNCLFFILLTLALYNHYMSYCLEKYAARDNPGRQNEIQFDNLFLDSFEKILFIIRLYFIFLSIERFSFIFASFSTVERSAEIKDFKEKNNISEFFKSLHFLHSYPSLIYLNLLFILFFFMAVLFYMKRNKELLDVFNDLLPHERYPMLTLLESAFALTIFQLIFVISHAYCNITLSFLPCIFCFELKCILKIFLRRFHILNILKKRHDLKIK